MKWDGIKAAEYFEIKRGEQNPEQYGHKPKHPPFTGLFDLSLAYERLYTECALSTHNKEELLSMLDKYIKNPPTDEKANDISDYQKKIVEKAKEIKKQIENEELPFQR